MTSKDVVLLAYRKLKQMVYYDKIDLFLRQRLAEFEYAADFEDKLRRIAAVVGSKEPSKHSEFQSWLREINYRLVPKTLFKENETGSGQFITNVTTASKYKVERVNFFFDGPIELHIIAVLWLLVQGRVLDQQLTKDCYGSKLYPDVGASNDNSNRLFRKYHELYTMWRDSGIRKAKQLLTEDRRSVFILGLDVKEYYYYIRPDFEAIQAAVDNADPIDSVASHFPRPEHFGQNLLFCIEKICHAYRETISEQLLLTHHHLHEDTGIPIGICSSPLLGNWHLREFDRIVNEKIRPAYYGRYVDDILMVIPSEESPGPKAIARFLDDVFVKSNILKPPVDECYEIVTPGGLYLQQDKCILQHFDSKHSIAGLEKFKKKLEENSSDFRLLPVEEEDGPLEEVAYDLLYAGSVNKFRSVKGIAENRYELAKHLARQNMTHLLTDDPPDKDAIHELRQFFRGRNAIDFHDLWERVFIFFIISGVPKVADMFAKQIQREINRLIWDNDVNTTNALRKNLEKHLSLSRSMADSLDDSLWHVSDISGGNKIAITGEMWRNTNLIRHNFVAEPLLNYTNYSGSLVRPKIQKRLKIDKHKLELSPRYVHFDELMLLATSDLIVIEGDTPFEWARRQFKELNGSDLTDIVYLNAEPEKGNSI